MSLSSVLIIDDNSTFRALVAHHLGRLGYTTLEAENGRLGVAVFRDENPDAVLIDLRMPGMDGFAVLSELAELSMETPFIVLSGAGQVEDAVKAIRQGAWDFVVKSESVLVELDQVVSKTLERAAFLRGQRQRLNRETKKRENAEEALRNQLSFIQVVIDAFPNQIFYKGIDGKYLGCNQSFADSCGVSKDQIIGKRIEEFAPKGEDDIYQGKDRELLATGGPQEFEVATSFGGEERTILVKKAIFYNEDGGVGGIVGVATDISKQKDIEQTLRQSEERYRAVFEDTGTAMVLLDSDGVISRANQQFVELSGYTREEIEGKLPWSLMVAKEDLQRLIETRKERLNSKDMKRSYEFCFLTKSKKIRHVHLQVNSMPGTTQSIVSLLDISDRRKAENKLRQALDEVEAIQHNTFIGIGLFKGDTLVRINRRGAEIFGYTPDEVIGGNGSQLFSSQLVFRTFRRRCLHDLATLGNYRTEYKFRRPDGVTIWVNLFGKAVDRDNLDQGIIWTVVDISKRKYNETVAALLYRISNAVNTTLDLEALYERIHMILNDHIEADNFFIALLDSSRRFLEFAYFEDEKDDYKGFVFDINKPGTTSLSVEVIRSGKPLLVSRKKPFDNAMLSTRTPVTQIFEPFTRSTFLKQKNTDEKSMLGARSEVWLGVPFIVKGEVVGVMAVQSYTNPHQYSVRDVDLLVSVSEQIALAIERKGNELDLHMAKELAEAANRSKDEFLANMSHEVRTPLNGVLGMLQLAQTTDLNEEQADYIDTALFSGRSLLSIINDILDFSKIEAGKLEVISEFFSVETVVQDVVSTFREQIFGKGLVVESLVGAEVPDSLFGGKNRLKQILFNLLGNAVKFTDSGLVAIYVHLIHKDEQAGKVRLLFSIEDSGIGIPDEKIDYIFEPFTQVDGSYMRRHQGTGLGLGIVKRLTGLLGGDLTIESEEGVGTTIHLSLPFSFSPVEKEADLVDLSLSSPARSGLKLLVVEDNRINRLMAGRMLEKLGHCVETARASKEGIRMVKSQAFDAIFMDIQMPGLDGLEATNIIRNTPPSRIFDPHIPIIAMTAHAMVGDREEFLKGGMTDYIAKPIELDEIKRVLSRLFSSE